MGASYVAGEIVDRLRQNYLDCAKLPYGAVPFEEFLPGPTSENVDDRWEILRYLVRWAALLHDVGHIPIGHTLEDEFDGIYQKHDDFASPRIPYIWYETDAGQESEVRRVFRNADLLPDCFNRLKITGDEAWQSVMLLCLHKESRSAESPKNFLEVLKGEEGKPAIPFGLKLAGVLEKSEARRLFFPYMADIVGDTICADYLDYVKRDSSNVGLDVVRDNRVVSRFFVGRDTRKQLRMALVLVDGRGKPRLDTCTSVVELVRQRFRFAEIIYYHKTKVAASAMLAKVFALVGKPPETGHMREEIDIDRAHVLSKALIKGGVHEVGKLEGSCTPAALMDPDIGDETLLFWMQQLAWKQLGEAVKEKDEPRTEKLLRGLSILQSLVRRKLYKVCLTIDQHTFRDLSPGSPETSEVERRIQEMLRRLRKDVEVRTGVERDMAAAAGWPEDSLILYVPPRKSQAKGIETGALDNGEVVTLGNHSAVKEQVAQLNRAYQGLWRIILLVHPAFQDDLIGLSKAADSLVRSLWPTAPDDDKIVIPLRDAAWFKYVRAENRSAAIKFANMCKPNAPEWSFFDDALKTTHSTVTDEEHADRAILLKALAEQGGGIDVAKSEYHRPASLTSAVEDRLSRFQAEGREGSVDAAEGRRGVLETIAKELAVKQRKLFGAKAR